MSDEDRIQLQRARHGRMRPSLVAITALLRGLPLFFCEAPRTPLRVLAIDALDTLHVLRTSEPLPRKRISELALLLDFQACTNAAWIARNCARQNTWRSGSDWSRPTCDAASWTISVGFENWKAGGRQSVETIDVLTRCVRTAKRSRGCRWRRSSQSRWTPSVATRRSGRPIATTM